MIVYECGVLVCSTCFVQVNRTHGESAWCEYCGRSHQRLGVFLSSVQRIRHWFDESRLINLLDDTIGRGYFWRNQGLALGSAGGMEALEDDVELIEDRLERLYHLRQKRAELCGMFARQGGWSLAPQILQDLFLKELEVNLDLLYLSENCFYELFWLNKEM